MDFDKGIEIVWVKRLRERCRVDWGARPGTLGLDLYLIGLGSLSLMCAGTSVRWVTT